MNFTVAIISVLALLVSLAVHEYSHALVGYILGDQTARRLGRLTLNPIKHIDPVGTVLVPLMGLMTGFPVIGWAKPVPFNPYNLKYHKWGATLVGLAGPTSNFLSAIVFLFVLKTVLVRTALPPDNLLLLFLFVLVQINVVLGIFNLIPIPPLDGSNLLETLLEAPKYRHIVNFLETRGPLLILGLIVFDSFLPVPIVGSIFGRAIDFFFSLAGL